MKKLKNFKYYIKESVDLDTVDFVEDKLLGVFEKYGLKYSVTSKDKRFDRMFKKDIRFSVIEVGIYCDEGQKLNNVFSNNLKSTNEIRKFLREVYGALSSICDEKNLKYHTLDLKNLHFIEFMNKFRYTDNKLFAILYDPEYSKYIESGDDMNESPSGRSHG